MAGIDKALSYLKTLPRVALNTLKPLPGQRKAKRSRRGRHGGRKCGKGHKGQHQRGTLPYLGFEGNNTPFYLIIPKEPYYEGHHIKRQYPPLSLLKLQRMIDIGLLDTSQPIDLTAICGTRYYTLDVTKRHYGVDLTDEGADIFDAKVNIEVQWASEQTIAAVEKNGGTILTKFYDLPCVEAMANPLIFFKKGGAIPRCKLPPIDAVEYYTEAKNRGYLADPEKIKQARFELAQKYGYLLPDITKDPMYSMLMMRKDPRQIWYGLEPGWVVNMKDKCIYKPKDELYKEYYSS